MREGIRTRRKGGGGGNSNGRRLSREELNSLRKEVRNYSLFTLRLSRRIADRSAKIAVRAFAGAADS
jgi:hypothetical protein